MKKRFISLGLVLLILIAMVPSEALAYLGAMGRPSPSTVTYGTEEITVPFVNAFGSRTVKRIKVHYLENDFIRFAVESSGEYTSILPTRLKDKEKEYCLNDWAKQRFTIQYPSGNYSSVSHGAEIGLNITDTKIQQVSHNNNPAIKVEYTFGDSNIRAYTTYQLVSLDKGSPSGETYGGILKESYESNNWGVLSDGYMVYSGPTKQYDDLKGAFDYKGVKYRGVVANWYNSFKGFPAMGHPDQANTSPSVAVNISKHENYNEHSFTNISNGLGWTNTDGRHGEIFWEGNPGTPTGITEAYTDGYNWANPFVVTSEDFYEARGITGEPGHGSGVQGFDIGDFPGEIKYDRANLAIDSTLTTKDSNGLPLTEFHNVPFGYSQLWGYRDIIPASSQEPTPPDQITVPKEISSRLGIFKSGNSYLALPAVNEAGLQKLINSHGQPVALLRGKFTGDAASGYKFEDGAVALSPSVTATWSGNLTGFTVSSQGVFTGIDPTIQLNCPSFKFYSPNAGGGLEINPSPNGLEMNIDPKKNKAVISVGIPNFGSEVEQVIASTDGKLNFSGSLFLESIFQEFSKIDLEDMQMGAKNGEYTINGIKAKGSIDAGNVLGIKVGGVKGEINTFPGQEKYSFSLNINIPSLLKVEGELDLGRIRSTGELVPDNLYANLNVAGGIPVAGSFLTITGGGLGAYNLVNTINGDFYALPPIKLRGTVNMEIIGQIDARGNIIIGPGYLSVDTRDVNFKGMNFLDYLGWELYLDGQKRNNKGVDYTGINLGGNVKMEANFPSQEINILVVNNKIGASYFAGIGNRSGKEEIYILFAANGKVESVIQIPDSSKLFAGKKLRGAEVQAALSLETTIAGNKIEDIKISALENAKVYLGVVGTTHFLGSGVRAYYIYPNESGIDFKLFSSFDDWDWEDHGYSHALLNQEGQQIGLFVMESPLMLASSENGLLGYGEGIENYLLGNEGLEETARYIVTVEDGVVDELESEGYKEGDLVTITANDPPEGQEFDRWASDDELTFIDEDSADTSFTMPNKDVLVKATYRELSEIDVEPEETARYIVTVEDGIVDELEPEGYKEGDLVTITANDPLEGQEFDKWTSDDGLTFIDEDSASTSFTMPNKDVLVKANYRDLPMMRAFGNPPPAFGGGSGGAEESITVEEGEVGEGSNLYLFITPEDEVDMEKFKDSLVVKDSSDSPIVLEYLETDGFTNADTANAMEGVDDEDKACVIVHVGDKRGKFTVSADYDFGLKTSISKPFTMLDASLLGTSITGQIKYPKDNTEYVLRTYLGNEEGSADYLLSQSDLGTNNINENLDLNGTLAPSGSYYVTSFLMEKVTGEFDQTNPGDETVLLPIDSTNFGQVDYVNNMQLDPPSSVSLTAKGNEVMTASWKKVADAAGYQVSIYQKYNGEWIDTGLGYQFDASDLENRLEDDEYKLDLAITGGDEESALPADATYKIVVRAYKYLEPGNEASLVYGKEGESGEKWLAKHKPLTMEIILDDETLSPDEGGIYKGFVNSRKKNYLQVYSQESGTFTVTRTDTGGEISPDYGYYEIPKDFDGILSLKIEGSLSNGEFVDVTTYYLEISVDDNPPILTLDAELFNADDETGAYTISGLSEPGTSIDYEGPSTVKADNEGRFQVFGTLHKYNDETFAGGIVRLTAIDTAGNESEPAYATVGVGSGGIFVIVNGGSGGGDYVAGETVTIIADLAPSGKVFDKWITEDGVALANPNASTTTFIMPGKSVRVTATYKDKPTSGGGDSSSGGSSSHTGAEQAKNQLAVGKVSINYTLGNKIANLSLTASKIREIIKETKGNEVVINLSQIKGIDGVSLPKNALEAFKDAGLDLTLKLATGTITMNKDAAGSIADQSGENLTIDLKQVDSSSLALEQRQAIKEGDIVFDINIISDKKKISNFDGSLSFQLPYDGPQPVGLWYLNEKGDLEKLSSTFENGMVSFRTNHLSHYVAGLDETKTGFKWTNPFTDVEENNWFYEAVKYVYEKGLMKGTGDTIFSPSGITTRGMIVTILHRLEGSPSGGANLFSDVEENKYYANSVTWAGANNIVNGYGDGKFGPEDPITREQMAVILMNYGKYKGYDVSARADLSKYRDSISSWSLDAMAWANAENLIQGDGTRLMATGNAQRCQVAAILQRFMENVAK